MILNIMTLYLIISIMATIYLSAFIFLNGRAIYMKIVGVECILVSVYAFGYMLELHADSLQDAIFWNYIQYTAIPFLNTIWLLMGLMYIGKIKKLKDRRVYLMFLIPVGTLIIRFTSHWHHLYYTSYKFNVVNDLQFMVLGKGIWYWVQSIYIITISIISIYIFIYAYHRGRKSDRAKYGLLIIASLIPIICEMVIYTVTRTLGLDPMAFCLPIATVLMAYAIMHYDFMEIRTLARDEFFESSIDSMLVLNSSMKIIDYNQNAVKFFKAHGVLLSESYLSDYHEQAHELISALEKEEVIYETRDNNGHYYWKIETKNVSDDRNEICGQLKTIRNVTDTIEKEKYLEKIAITDELTQLYNRHEFMNKGNEIITKVLPEDSYLAMIMLDIDHFKRVNDTFGHQAGDVVLKGIARSIAYEFRDNGLVARIGGEEFAVIPCGLTKKEVFEHAENLRKYVEKTSFLSETEYRVTVSLGIAESKKGDTLTELMKRSDEALYRAKTSGRNKVCIY